MINQRAIAFSLFAITILTIGTAMFGIKVFHRNHDNSYEIHELKTRISGIESDLAELQKRLDH